MKSDPAALPVGAENLPRLTAPLLAWYKKNARMLPWRSVPTPYRVWVSEIMLQQTRVEAVLPYFERFLAAFPNIAALAAAPEGELFKLWEGLGYYSRARNLQKAARIVLERFGGALPGSFDELRALPGVGDYTAGAITSIAFGLPVPAVDGNVMRVLARLLCCDADITRPETKRIFTAADALMLPPDSPGDFNQAMMELGATVCLPNGAPLCGTCPLRDGCVAHALGNVQGLPFRPPKKPRVVQQRTLALLVSPRDVLLRKRPTHGLLASLWEYPGFDGLLTQEDLLLSAKSLGASSGAAHSLGGAKHIFTHREWQMQGWLVPCAAFEPPAGCVWAGRAALRDTYALPSAFRVFTQRLLEFLPPDEETLS